jgi:DNA primase
METMGYVGEEHGKLLVYLIGISRKLPRPMSGIILSQAGVGKSSLTEMVEQLTPPEDVLLFTRITAQALIYMVDNILKGKLLIVEERVGAEAAEYSIRVLQSRQRLSQAVPIKDPATGQIVTKFFTVEGPVAYLETTTNPKINHENATRCFEITLDESEAQTQRIQVFQRMRRLPSRRAHHRAEEDVTKRHHNAQRLLEDVTVFIPYADQLTFPSKKLRTRRDNERFLCLIEASAYLHQFQRKRGTTEDGTPYVLADLDDYRLAYELAKDVLSDTLHELTRGARELWVAIRAWVGETELRDFRDARFTRRDLRALTGTEDHQLRSALQELAEMEYIEVIQGGTGKTFHYSLAVAEELHAPVTLLTPEELEAKLREQA